MPDISKEHFYVAPGKARPMPPDMVRKNMGAVMDKMGFVRGKVLPPQQMSYWRKKMRKAPYG